MSVSLQVKKPKPIDRKDPYRQRLASLEREQTSWTPHWLELSKNILPRNGQFLMGKRNTQSNRGAKVHNDIYDNTATRSSRILSAGMMAGMTSPARPWFRLATGDPDMMRYEPVKIWLADVTRMMLAVFAASNTYRALHNLYDELGVFGTAATIVAPDFDNIIHHHPLTVGEYFAATNFKGEVDTLYRQFEKPVGALVKEFAVDANGKVNWDNVSQRVRRLWENNQLEEQIELVHAIEPRADRDLTSQTADNMAWKSVYFERNGERNTYLREGGFKKFPALVPRWMAQSGDVYGSSPGMEALGDIKQLQHEQLRKANAIDYMTKPPLQAPSGMKNQMIDMMPGGISFTDMAAPTGGIRSVFEVRLDLQHLLADIQDVRSRISSAFYADMFLMIASADKNGLTATEVAERHEEKLLMLGPVLERLHNELLSPMIEMTFDRLAEAGVLPPPPPEMEGQQIDVDFISMLAQAQKAVRTNSVDRWVNTLIAVSGAKAGILDKLNEDELAEQYADDLGVDPRLVNDDKVVAAQREARAKQAEQQQQMLAASEAAKAGKDLGAIDMGDGTNAAQNIVNQFSGYGSPSAEEY